MNDFVRPESMEVPEGGIASFLTATTGEWADTGDVVPTTGIGGVKAVADKLADYGRYEDTYMVHAAEGETVIPMAVFDENPRLKATLFNQMRSMGIDPERYVVGSELNSINPVTGQPEFFLKKLFRGLKKAVKKVIKVIKKVAPIALSIGLSFTPLGMIAGSALGSGIGTLIQGGSLKDALKMGAIGGLTAGLFKGVTGGFKGMQAGGEGFFKGFGSGVRSGLPTSMQAGASQALNQSAAQAANQALPGPVAPAGSTGVAPAAAGAGTPLNTGQTLVELAKRADQSIPGASTTQNLAAGMRQPNVSLPQNMQMTVRGTDLSSTGAAAPPVKTISSPLPQDNAFYQKNPVFDPNAATGTAAGTAADTAAGTVGSTGGGIADTSVAADTAFNFADDMAQKFGPQPVQKPPGFFSSLKDMVTPGGDDFFTAGKKAFLPSSYSPEEIMRSKFGLGPDATFGQVKEKVFEQLGETITLKDYPALVEMYGKTKGFNPNMLRQYGPLAAAGIGALGLSGGFEAPEMEPPPDPFGMGGQSGFDLLAADPQAYRVFYAGAPYNLGGRPYGAAEGGSTSDFPRRDGAIAGPGTEKSDDIPAMLSDGEFVMTAQAVRGAGNGSRNQGVKKMYEIMRTYEGAA